jgi:hypothetical protein
VAAIQASLLPEQAAAVCRNVGKFGGLATAGLAAAWQGQVSAEYQLADC